MNGHRVLIVSALALTVLSACGTSPPRVSCGDHLTPINVAITVGRKGSGRVVPPTRSDKAPKGAPGQDVPHGR